MKDNLPKLTKRMLKMASVALIGFMTVPAMGETVIISDTDHDTKISRTEYVTSSKTYLVTADIDRDGYLNGDEMTEATFRAWDKNGNGEIVPAEFHSGLDTLAETRAKAITFESWDRNNDNEVHMDEFREGIRTTGLYTSVYTSPTVKVEVPRFQETVFEYYDLNNDGFISGAEMPKNRPLYVIMD